MRRLFWLGLGLAVGALVVRQVSKKAESFTPRGLSRSLSESVQSLADAAREFAAEVRLGMAEREQELMAALVADNGSDPSAPFDTDPVTGAPR
jgi:hypothetical protein